MSNGIAVHSVVVPEAFQCPWCGISFEPDDEGTELVLEGRQGKLVLGQKSGRLMVSDEKDTLTDKLVITVHPWCGLEVVVEWYSTRIFDTGEPFFGGGDVYCAGCGVKLDGRI